MIGPAQSAERVWPKRGSEAKGRSFVGFAERGCSCVEASERKRNEREKEFSVWKTVGFSRRAGFSKRANVREAACTSSLPFWGSGRGGLHVKSAIDSYEEVILP